VDRYSYATLDDIKAALGIPTATTTDDSLLLNYLIATTRFIESREGAGRRFVPWTGTKRYDGSGAGRLYVDDLLSVTTLVDDDDTWASTDYLLYPRNAAADGEPYRWIEVDPDGDYSTFTDEADVVVITGEWGYAADTEDSGATVATTQAAGDTTLVIATGSNVKIGHLLLIGSERQFVAGKTTGSPNDTYTVVRGLLGTTAAEHTSGTAISYYLAPYDIWFATVEIAKNLYRMKDVFGEEATAIAELGRIRINRAVTRDVRDVLTAYRHTGI